ncbi:MAG: protein-L-isoaspartate(D-aspartate) O-methyltransferase [Dehalococcoidia bacterium]|nr:protein-L-isoaspartate(D-aspartate) O-methyltransferase [Dehalococcoidia bacterium]
MESDFAAARRALVEGLRQEIRDERVLEAMRRVPREKFVPEQYQRYAYDDRPLPIGQGQTISQPLMVAIMTDILRLAGTEKVLEVGTGSGYQAAILAELAREVVTVERMAELAESAAQRLRELGYGNVSVHVNERGLGWPEEAPYDAIVVTAGAPQVPQSLVDQLAIGGRMVIPVGGRRVQQLLRVVREPHGTSVTRHGQCRFVPLVGEGAWSEEEESEAEY